MKHWRADPTADARPSWHDRSPDIDAQRFIWEQEDATRLHALLDADRSLRRSPVAGELPCPECSGKGYTAEPFHYIRGEGGNPMTCSRCLGSSIR